ncbi:MAG: Ig-like domain-containing protein [Saprospiraceae bacterium]
MTRFYFYTVLLFLAISLFACARVGAPTGGPKDATPPQVESLASSPNYTTRFQESRIRLTFDEWVVLKDAATQVLISPPLNKRPDITLRGKTVTVKFAEGEILRPSTTYTINFGSAIQDLHEGNAAKDLRFVFSTGDFLDSLSISGAVADAFTGDPVENVSVMLYEHLDDSVARNEKPYYFARTDKNGVFTIPNVKEGRFKMLAFEDKDQNLKWSSDNESIAFVDSVWNINPATSRRFSSLSLFRDQARFRLFDKNASRFGLIKLVYTGPPDSIRLRTEEEVSGLRLLPVKNQDTLLVWYDLPEPTGWRLLAGLDTVTVRDISRVDFLKTYRLGLVQEAVAPVGGGGKFNKPAAVAPPDKVQPPKSVNQNPDKQAFLDFVTPIVSLDTTKWLLGVDSSQTTGFMARPDSADPRRVRIIVPWKAGKIYQLAVLPGAVTDFYGVRNADTIRANFTVLSEKQLGGLNLTITSLVPKTNYVLQLLNGKEVLEERLFQAELTEKRLIFTNLLTALYTVQLIEDRNGNGKWDTGDYYAHRQPERIFTKKLEALRPNWEVEATIEASAKGNGSKKEKGKSKN